MLRQEGGGSSAGVTCRADQVGGNRCGKIAPVGVGQHVEGSRLRIRSVATARATKKPAPSGMQRRWPARGGFSDVRRRLSTPRAAHPASLGDPRHFAARNSRGRTARAAPSRCCGCHQRQAATRKNRTWARRSQGSLPRRSRPYRPYRPASRPAVMPSHGGSLRPAKEPSRPGSSVGVGDDDPVGLPWQDLARHAIRGDRRSAPVATPAGPVQARPAAGSRRRSRAPAHRWRLTRLADHGCAGTISSRPR